MDRRIIVCLDVKKFPTVDIKGCIYDKCFVCMTPVWLAPTSVNMISRHDVDLMCFECMKHLLDKQKPDTEVVVTQTKEQVQELKDNGWVF